jgi:hypothetical protein
MRIGKRSGVNGKYFLRCTYHTKSLSLNKFERSKDYCVERKHKSLGFPAVFKKCPVVWLSL